LEQRALAPAFRADVRALRRGLMIEMTRAQGDWRSWRWRDTRGLGQVRALVGSEPELTQADRLACGFCHCD
jgi:hypothetical protein